MTTAYDITPDCGASGSYDWKSNTFKFFVPYVMPTLDEAIAFQPTYLPAGLPATNRQFHQRNDGQWDLVLQHEGIVGDPSPNNDTAELDYMTAEDPIETFPKFDQLATRYKGKFASDGSGRFEGFPLKFLDGDKKVKNPFYGVTHFLNPAPIWRVTLTRKTFPGSLLSSLGKISNPLSVAAANPPALSNEKNWLKRSVKAAYKGNAWTITIEWTGSGDGGWVRDLYGADVGDDDDNG